MTQAIRWFCCGLIAASVGCSISEGFKLTGKKSDQNKIAQPDSIKAGSPDFTTSNKLKNPAKTRLAYAACHEETGNYLKAREAYLEVLKKSPKDTEALLGLARIDRIYGRHDDADAQLQKALKYHPKDPRIHLAIGLAHESNGELSEALQEMRTAHDIARYEPIYEYHLAVVEARTGEIDQAMEHFGRSVGKAEAHFNVGHILNEQGRTSEAEKHFKQALRLKPHLKQAATELAELQSGEVEDIQPVSFRKKK